MSAGLTLLQSWPGAWPPAWRHTGLSALPHTWLRCLVAGIALLVLSACSRQPGDATGGLQPGERAPDVVFRTLTGQQFSLHDFDGPVLVNFWATDCHICVEETPMLSELWERLSGAGYAFVAVAMPHDRPDSVVQLVQDSGWKHPVAIDISGDVVEAFGNVPGTPTSFLIAGDGTLDTRLVGRVDLGKLESRIRALL